MSNRGVDEVLVEYLGKDATDRIMGNLKKRIREGMTSEEMEKAFVEELTNELEDPTTPMLAPGALVPPAIEIGKVGAGSGIGVGVGSKVTGRKP